MNHNVLALRLLIRDLAFKNEKIMLHSEQIEALRIILGNIFDASLETKERTDEYTHGKIIMCLSNIKGSLRSQMVT